MQTQPVTTSNVILNLLPSVKQGEKRGRKPLPFVAGLTPSGKVRQALKEYDFLNFEQLQAKTHLSEDTLGLALSNLIINTREVRTFCRHDIRYYFSN